MLWNLFAKNPFLSFEKMMAKVMVCAEKTKVLFEALFEKDKERVQAIAKEISQAEYDCDLLKREIRAHISKSVFISIDRRDVIHILSNMDAIANYSEDLGVLLTLRWLELPKEMQPEFQNLFDRTMLVVAEAKEVIELLHRLMESGFSGPDAQEVLKRIDHIEELEHQADKAQDVFGKKLFGSEEAFSPAELVLWMKIANKVGDIANATERMVGHIRLMLAVN